MSSSSSSRSSAMALLSLSFASLNPARAVRHSTITGVASP